MNENTLMKDLTTGSVSRQLLIFAMPLMLSNLLQTVYNMVDMIVVGQFVGHEGLSGASIGGDILHLLAFVVMGFSNAGQVMISQYMGAGDKKSINSTIGTMFTFILSSAVVLSVFCVIFAHQILNAVNTPVEAYKYAFDYSMTCYVGLIFIYGYNTVSAILRGMGNSKQPFIFIAIAAVANIILDLIFVAVFKWSVFGAALATVIAQASSFIWSLIYLYRRREAFGFDFKLESFKINKHIFIRFIKLGLPMCLQSGAIMFSMIFVNAYINAYGVVASAVTGIGNKLGSITNVVTYAMSTAGSSMVGQSLGAGKRERIPKVVGFSLFIGLAFAAVLSLATVFFPEIIFGLFNNDAEVLDMAMIYIPVAILLYVGAAVRSPFMALINGSGQTRLNMIVGILDGVICRIGLALLMGMTFKMGVQGFWYGNAIAGFVPFLIGGVYYLSGKWKVQKLIIN
ncbi:MAG: MATE family efflux transporter [Oscillospiraceae bacterium]